MKQNIRPLVFLLCFLAFFSLFDYACAVWGENPAHGASNDFEVTRADHPEQVWDKVFFGNSAVIAGYREDISESGYVNLGMDYAVVTDLLQLLKQDHIRVGSELVIGLNFFTLYDDFDTNPAYIWHRRPLEPYSYFHRDKLLKMAKAQVKSFFAEDTSPYIFVEKILYYGSLSDEELAGKMNSYQEKYFCLSDEKFQENIHALDQIANLCDAQNVRLRLLWMPFNPSVDRPERMQALYTQVHSWCETRGIETMDMTDALDESCFHDVGHLNYEHGAYEFTKAVDKWLVN